MQRSTSEGFPPESKALAEVGKKIQQADADLDARLLSAEKFFCDLKMGVSAMVPLGSGSLGFGRCQEGWRLLYAPRVIVGRGPRIQPLLGADRNTRMAAAGALPALVAALSAEAEAEIERVRVAVASAEAFVEAIRATETAASSSSGEPPPRRSGRTPGDSRSRD